MKAPGTIRASKAGSTSQSPAAGFVEANDLAQQDDLERRAERPEQAQPHIRGEREIARLGVAMGVRQQGAVGERDQRIDRVAADERQSVKQEAPGDALARRADGERGVGQRAADAEERDRDAGEAAEQHDRRIARQPGAADHQDQRHDVLDDDHPGIGGVEEAGAGDRPVIIEQARPDAGQHGGRQQHRRQSEIDPRRHGRDEERRERQADAGGQDIERGADLGLGLARLERIEPHRREPQPVEHRRVDQNDDGGANGVAAELGWTEKQRDEQAEDEIQAGIDDEGQQDGHVGLLDDPSAAPRRDAFGDSGFRAERVIGLA